MVFTAFPSSMSAVAHSMDSYLSRLTDTRISVAINASMECTTMSWLQGKLTTTQGQAIDLCDRLGAMFVPGLVRLLGCAVWRCASARWSKRLHLGWICAKLRLVATCPGDAKAGWKYPMVLGHLAEVTTEDTAPWSAFLLQQESSWGYADV